MRTSPPKLLVHGPDKGPLEYVIQQQEIVIGRDPASQLPLNDRKISRAHARILGRKGTYTIRDLGSRNGTYVNDKKIGPEDGEVTIGDKDRIRVGNHIIQCTLPGATSADETGGNGEREKTKILAKISEHLLDPPEDLTEDGEDGAEWPPRPEKSPGDELETGVIRQEELERHRKEAESVDLALKPSKIGAMGEETPGEEEDGPDPEEEDDEATDETEKVDGAEEPSRGDTSLLPQVTGDTNYDIMADLEELRLAKARCLISREEGSADSRPIERRRATIGRGRHNDIVISHHTVSSVHAEIQFGPEGFSLVDKNSTNGTYVDNGRIRSRRLSDGSYVMFGGVMGLFLHEIEADPKAIQAEEERLSEGLVRRGIISRGRAREALEEAGTTGARLAEVLILAGDVTPAEWWETARLTDPNRARSNPASIIVPILIVLAVILAAVAYNLLF